MATVEVSFTPLPAHVRTARLVATAVARRSGVAESLLDEVRLAVGEACSRAVEAHRRYCPAEPVRIALTDHAGRFEVEVIDTGTAARSAAASAAVATAGLVAGVPDGAAPRRGAGAAVSAAPAPGDPAGPPRGFGLAVIAGLADDVQIRETDVGTTIRMSWPSAGLQPEGLDSAD